jgi:hypothetical protein
LVIAEGNARIARHAGNEVRKDLPHGFFFLLLARFLSVHPPGRDAEAVCEVLVAQVDICLVQQTYRADHPCQGARGIRASTESNDENAIPFFVVPADERIAAHDAGDHPGAEHTAQELHDRIGRIADTMQVLGDLRHRFALLQDLLGLVLQPARVKRRFALEQVKKLQYVGDIRNAVLVLVNAGPVPCSIRTEDDVLHDDSPPYLLVLDSCVHMQIAIALAAPFCTANNIFDMAASLSMKTCWRSAFSGEKLVIPSPRPRENTKQISMGFQAAKRDDSG